MHHLIAKTLKLVADNSPTILTTIGVTGTVVTAYLTGRATFRASELIAIEETLVPSDAELTDKDKIGLVWREYIPAFAVGTLTIACIIGANRIGTRRAAALAAAYSLTEKAFDEYKDKVRDQIGAQREQRVRDEIAQDRVSANPVSSNQVIITGNGDVLCYDAITGRYFNSNVEAIRKAQNDINRDILHNLYATLSEFYGYIGLPSTSYSTEVGWNVDDYLDIDFSAVLSEDGRPCISISYQVSPIRGFSRLS
jgi:hypothetical protein